MINYFVFNNILNMNTGLISMYLRKMVRSQTIKGYFIIYLPYTTINIKNSTNNKYILISKLCIYLELHNYNNY